MKYDFALDFTPEGVRLLQGSGDDTIVFGSVGFGDPHFDTRVEDLRKEAEEVHGGPFATALLLPHSEVLFHTMKVEEGTEITEKAVRAELEGMTPYDVDDLAYDWKSLSKTQVEIAAVARETLSEADAFAAQHGFGPGPFSTAPNPKAFRGQPSFGASDRPMPEPEPAPEPEPQPAPLPEPAPVPVPETTPDLSGPSADLPAPKADDAPKVEPAKPASAPEAAPSAAKDTAPAPATTEPAEALAKSDAPAAAPPAEPKDKPSGKEAGDKPLIDDFTEPQVARPPYQTARPESPQPKMGEGILSAPSRRSSDTSKSDAADRSPSFSSRRTNGSSGSGVATALGAAAAAGAVGIAGAATAATVSRLGSITERAASLPDGGAGASGGRRPTPKDPPKSKAGPVPPTRRMTAPAAPKPSGRGAAPGRVAPTPTVRKVETPESVSGAAKSLSTAPGSANPKPPLSEAESLTVFGMRGEPKSRTSAVLPILIGLVVAVMLAVAAWWAFSAVGDPDDTAPVVEQSSALPIEEPDQDVSALDETAAETASVEDTALADEAPAEDVTVLAEPAPEQPAAEVERAAEVEPAAEVERAAEVEPEGDAIASEERAPTETATPDPELEPGPDDPLRRSQDAPEATRYAATGVSTAAPSSPETPTADSAELEGPQGDSTIRVQDGVATLDAPQMASLSAPARLAPPPPPGARFELDENGRVLATPEGTLSPQGVRITAGQPPVVPPQAPNRPAATTEADSPVEESSVDVPVTDGQPSATPPERPAGTAAAGEDQAAVGPAPLARPDDVAVTRRETLDSDEIADEAGDVALDGPQDTPEGVVQTPTDAQVVLAALSPRARPDRATDEPEPPQITEEQSAAQAEAVAAAIASVIPGLEEATDEAVARSLRPGNRPANFARTVEQTRQAAPVQVASASATVTPRNPTAGSVASSATQKDTIRLNRINLIGVYGTQSNRRALIRLPSGRFVKVKVGDSVDGGRVNAIDSDKLQYVKGGRQVVLAIPAG